MDIRIAYFAKTRERAFALPFVPAVMCGLSDESPESLFNKMPDLDGVILSCADLQTACVALDYGKHVLLPPGNFRGEDLYKLASLAVRKELLLMAYQTNADAKLFAERVKEEPSRRASLDSVRAYYAACGFSEKDTPALFI